MTENNDCRVAQRPKREINTTTRMQSLRLLFDENTTDFTPGRRLFRDDVKLSKNWIGHGDVFFSTVRATEKSRGDI